MMFNSFHHLRRLCGRQNTATKDKDINTHPSEESDSAAPVLDTSTLALRYRAYGILYCAGIPLCVWFEDALAHLGVPTETFCLYLLVPAAQLSQAADHLINDGNYSKRELPLPLRRISRFANIYGPPVPEHIKPPSPITCEDGSQYIPDPNDRVDPVNPPVILLPAEEWFYELPPTAAEMLDCYPTLSQILTSLILRWLAEDEENLSIYVSVMIEYIYDYLEGVKTPGFENLLPEEIRRFHLDMIHGRDPSGELQTGIWSCQKYYRDEMEKTLKISANS